MPALACVSHGGVMRNHVTLWGLDLNLVLMLTAGVAIAAELLLLRLRHRVVDYRDVGQSMVQGVSWVAARLVLGKALLFGVWIWTWEHLSLLTVDAANPLSWVAYWIIGDFLYYWTHRAEHRVRLLWSSHLIHHSSEQFNLATAGRQPWTEVFYKPVIALWAPLLGFHPMMYVVFGLFSLMVGQWQHLEWFPKLRWLDAISSARTKRRPRSATERRDSRRTSATRRR